MPLTRWTLPLLLLAPALLAGCSSPDGAEATAPTASTGTSVTPPRPGAAGFQVVGPTITPLDGSERELREDDGALIRYTLRQPADASGPSAALVSFILNGNVSEIETLQLAPGQEKAYERKLDRVRDLKEVKVEVRAGQSIGQASARVLAWPRAPDQVAFDPYFLVRVDNWTRNETSAQTEVGLTLQRGAQPFHEFRVHLLCVDAEGAVSRAGTVRPELQPHPNVGESHLMRYPLCPAAGETYGVEVKADTPDGKGVHGRVLFVPAGWAPAPAAAS